MYNYRENRELFKPNSLGSLYIDKEIDKNKRPVIYIGGQMEHRFHVVEQTGFTLDPGHKMFDGSWFYDYSIIKGNKNDINCLNFANNLILALEEAKIGDVDLVTESCGGLIAAVASNSSIIHKVVAIHPSILGTPLANKDLLLEKLNELELQQKLIARIVRIIVNDNYGFQKDNARGINNPELRKLVDLSKLVVVGSSIDETDKNNLAKSLRDLIYKVSGKQNDGVVIFEPQDLKKEGINYIVEEQKLNHFDAGSKENIEKAYKLVLKGKNNEIS